MKNGAWVPCFLRTEVSGRAEVAGSVSMAVDVIGKGDAFLWKEMKSGFRLSWSS